MIDPIIKIKAAAKTNAISDIILGASAAFPKVYGFFSVPVKAVQSVTSVIAALSTDEDESLDRAKLTLQAVTSAIHAGIFATILLSDNDDESLQNAATSLDLIYKAIMIADMLRGSCKKEDDPLFQQSYGNYSTYGMW